MRRRTHRTPMPVSPRRRAVAVAVAAERPAIPLRAVALLALALLLALLLPRLAGAAPSLTGAPAMELGAGAARIHVETAEDAQVLVEWGLAPNAARVVRSSGGTSHDLALVGLEPGRIYVYRVLVDGRVVVPATPFRTAGAPPAAAPLDA